MFFPSLFQWSSSARSGPAARSCRPTSFIGANQVVGETDPLLSQPSFFHTHQPYSEIYVCSSSSKSLIYQMFNYVNGFGFVNDKDVLFCKKHWFLSHRWKELRTKTGLIPEHKRDLVAAQGGGGAAFATPRPVLSSCTRPIFQPAWT